MPKKTGRPERREPHLEDSLLILKGLGDAVSDLSFLDSDTLSKDALFAIGRAITDYAEEADFVFQTQSRGDSEPSPAQFPRRRDGT